MGCKYNKKKGVKRVFRWLDFSAPVRFSTRQPINRGKGMARPKWTMRAFVLASLAALAAAGPPIIAKAKLAPKMAALRAEVAAPPRVNLGLAGKFVILAKAGISTVPASSITGNIGVSPIAAEAMTGFSLTADASNIYSTTTQVTGKAFAADYASTTPATLTEAVLDMEAAYTDASSRAFSGADYLNIGGGLIAGATFTEGIYQWGSDVNFASAIYIKGNKDSRYIFQSTGNVVAGSDAQVAINPQPSTLEREFFIDNLLVRIHFIIVMIRWTGLAPWEFE